MTTNRSAGEIKLEPISVKRKSEFLRLAKSSKQFHKSWVQAPLTEMDFESYIKRTRRKNSKSFFLCRISDKKLVGVINISQIVQGFFQSAFLGYYVFKPFAKNGYMTEGLTLVLKEAFLKIGLHRLEANIQPTNLPSKKAVKRLGFRLEGYSPRYLRVKEKWCDHERWAITIEDWANASKKKRVSRPTSTPEP